MKLIVQKRKTAFYRLPLILQREIFYTVIKPEAALRLGRLSPESPLKKAYTKHYASSASFHNWRPGGEAGSFWKTEEGIKVNISYL